MKGSEVREIREARGWNKTELAQFLNVDVSTISRIENGKCNVSPLMERCLNWVRDGGFVIA